jgi:4-carboxymuconolactone decarboxylase
MTDRTAAGRGVYARNLGVNHAEAERTLTERVDADFTREVFEAAGGLGWQSTALTDRDRSIAIIAALVCQPPAWVTSPATSSGALTRLPR